MKSLKLTRAQELALINFGVAQLLSNLAGGTDTKKAHSRKKNKRKSSWTPERRAKFAKTMAATWKRKKAEKHGKTV